MSESTYLEIVIIISICGFFAGSILFSKIFPKLLCGIDITAVSEDGNPGVSNVFKYCSVPVGIAAGICDFAKAFFPILIADILIPFEYRTPIFGFVIASAVLGHIFSVFNHGNGGMGVAPMFGSLMAIFRRCYLVYVLIIIYVLVRYVFRCHQQHRRTIICFSIFFVVTALFEPSMVYKPVYMILSVVICLKCIYIAIRQKNSAAASPEQIKEG